jgi:hypothetical protein
MEYWPNCADITQIADSLGVVIPTRRIQGVSANNQGGLFTIIATVTAISSANPTVDGCTMALQANTGGDGAIKWQWTGAVGGAPIAAAYLPKG